MHSFIAAMYTPAGSPCPSFVPFMNLARAPPIGSLAKRSSLVTVIYAPLKRKVQYLSNSRTTLSLLCHTCTFVSVFNHKHRIVFVGHGRYLDLQSQSNDAFCARVQANSHRTDVVFHVLCRLVLLPLQIPIFHPSLDFQFV